MTTPSPAEIELLRRTYAAFNARDIDAAVGTMTPDVEWPMAFKGGVARGHDGVRAYWTEQWSEIDPHVEPVGFTREADGRALVDVHLVVRDLGGNVVVDTRVGHRFAFEGGLIRSMEVVEPPAA